MRVRKGARYAEEVSNSVWEIREGFLEVVMFELRPRGKREPREEKGSRKECSR